MHQLILAQSCELETSSMSVKEELAMIVMHRKGIMYQTVDHSRENKMIT